MANSYSKQTSNAILKRSKKSLESVKTFLEPCRTQHLSKVLTAIKSRRSSTSKALAPPPASFHLFSQLPFEIREIIWTIYASFPQIHILTGSLNPAVPNPWPLKISPSPNPHPSFLTCRESSTVYQKRLWLRTLEQVLLRTQTHIADLRSATPVLPPFISVPGNDWLDWEDDILWFKDVSTVKKLLAGGGSSEMSKYDDVRKVALDYSVLDYEDELPSYPDSYQDMRWRKRFVNRWYGLVIVLSMFRHLEEVYFVLEVEGGVNEPDGITTFEEVDVNMLVKRRLEGVNGQKSRIGHELRFPQLDDKGMYPQAALDVVFDRLVRTWDWTKPKVRYVYAKNDKR